MSNAVRRSIEAVVVIIIAGAVFFGACWAIRETPEKARLERRATAQLVRQTPPDGVVTTLVAIAAQRQLRSHMFTRFPFVRLTYQRKIPADDVAELTEEAFIRFSGRGHPDENDIRRMRDLLKFSETLSPSCSPSEALALRERQLDAHFLVKDYDGTIAMLEAGLAGRSTNWIAGTIAKLRAHKAVDLQQWNEAIKQFGIFGQCLLNESEDEPADCDPATGVVYSREWMVAKNYNRCAGLYAKLLDRPSALRMLNLAKEYYVKALDKAKDDPKSLAVLKAEVKPLGL